MANETKATKKQRLFLAGASTEQLVNLAVAYEARVEYDDVESAHTKQRQQAQQRLKAAAAAAVAKASPKRTPSASSGGAVSSPSSRNLDLSASNAAAVVSSDLDDSPATGTYHCKWTDCTAVFGRIDYLVAHVGSKHERSLSKLDVSLSSSSSLGSASVVTAAS